MALTTQDIEPILDITALETVSASQISQVTSTARMGDDKGIIIETEDSALDTPVVPDPETEYTGITPTWWTRYLWRRVDSFNEEVKLYQWNPYVSSDATYLKWIALDAGIETALANAATAVATANQAATDVAAFQTDLTAITNTANTANTNSAAAVADVAALTAVVDAIDDEQTTLQTAVAFLDQQINPLAVAQGGTGGITVAAARTNLGLANTPIGIALLWHKENTTIDGGTATAGSWEIRTLNTSEISASAQVTLNGDNSFTLLAGKYIIEAWAVAYNTGLFQIALAYSTAPTVPIRTGLVVRALSTGAMASHLYDVRTILDTLSFNIIQQVESTKADNGYGLASDFGSDEVYAVVKITRLSN